MQRHQTIANFDDGLYQDFYTRVIHALVVLLVAVPFISGDFLSESTWFWAIITVGVLYDILPFAFKRLAFLSNRGPSLAIHYALYFFLIVFFVPIGHPLELSSFLIVATGAYWLGYVGFYGSFGSIVLSLSVAIFTQNITDYSVLSDLLIRVLLLAALGAIIVRYTVQDQKQRKQLVDTSRVANYERRRLLSLINSMADAVIAIDRTGHIQLYNGAALSLLNTNDTLNDKNINDYLVLQNKKGRKYQLLDLVGTRPRIVKRDNLLFSNNRDELVNLFIDIAPVRISGLEKSEEGYIVLMRDITKEKTIEEQRDEFISIVSHELRTPIAITEANISTAMLPTVKSAKQRLALMEQAHKNILFLASLVNDITLLAHAEQGGLDSKLTKQDAKKIAEQLHSNYKEQAKEKKLKLELAIEPVPKIKTNVERLNEILQDFITNAIKYTEKGTVTIEVTRADKNHVRFGIRDTGIGISSSDQKKVFEKFYRSEDFRTREHSGTGLGLYIATRLAALIKAHLGLESEINKGSVFYVDVPVFKK